MKGCRAIQLDELVLDRRGPLHDRRWLVVDADTGAFMTQREHPRMATIEVAVADEGASVDVEVSVAGGARIRLPSDGPGPVRRVAVWRTERLGRDCGDDAAAWFSDVLSHGVRVLSDAGAQGGKELAFADGYPLLVTNQASLKDFNKRLERPLPMGRFRPNLVIAGARAWAEDDWSAIGVGELAVDLVKPCDRCVVINTDQGTGAVAPEPLQVLATFRRREADAEGGGGAMFGVNGVHSGTGTLRVGDSVEVLA